MPFRSRNPFTSASSVTDQINGLGQAETDLEAGDFIKVRMDVPRQNTVDIYCHVFLARLQGVGEAPF